MRRSNHRLVPALLAAVLLASVAGHVCTLPGYAVGDDHGRHGLGAPHVAPRAGDALSAPGSHDVGMQPVHGNACTMASATASPTGTPASVGTVGQANVDVVTGAPATALSALAAHDASPPLFLLHAALLI